MLRLNVECNTGQYEGARKNFTENCRLVGPNPMADPQNWNLNNGLIQLATAIEQDFDQTQHLLQQILNALRQR
jgi:hypothetical protein